MTINSFVRHGGNLIAKELPVNAKSSVKYGYTDLMNAGTNAHVSPIC